MIRKIFYIFFMLIFASCMQVEDSQTATNSPVGEYRKVTPEKAKEMMVEGSLILDVRTPEEFEQGHIPGAVLLPVQDILNNKLDLLPDKEQTILIYCRSGNRSAHATRSLIREGYTNVIDFGGIIDWPYEIE